MKLIRKITERIARRNPIEYARKIGVKVGNECRFTGNPRWGSEPWLIQVENQCTPVCRSKLCYTRRRHVLIP